MSGHIPLWMEKAADKGGWDDAMDDFSKKLQEAKDKDPNAFKIFLNTFMDKVSDIKSQMGLSSAIENVKHSFQLPGERFKEKLLFELEKSIGSSFYKINDYLNELAMDLEGYFMENMIGSGIGALVGGIIGSLLGGHAAIGAGIGSLFGGMVQTAATGGGTSIMSLYQELTLEQQTYLAGLIPELTPIAPSTSVTLLEGHDVLVNSVISLPTIVVNPVTTAQIIDNRATRIDM